MICLSVFFYAARVEAVAWNSTTDASLCSVTPYTTMNTSYSYSYNPNYVYDYPDNPNYAQRDYFDGGSNVYKHTVYYVVDCNTFGFDTTSSGAMILDFIDSLTIDSGYSSGGIVSNISDITLYAPTDGFNLIILSASGDTGGTNSLRCTLYSNHVYCPDAFRVTIAVTYEYVVGIPLGQTSPSTISCSFKSTGVCSFMAMNYTAGVVASDDASLIIQSQQNISNSQILEQQAIAESQAQQSQEQHEETKGFLSNIIDGILDLPGKILDVLVSVFVPDAEYFSSLFDEMNSFFSERFGLLYYPFEVVINFANLFLSPDASDGSVPFPEISWNGTTIISAQDVSIIQDDSFLVLQERLYFVGNVIMAGALINLAHKKINEVMKS